MPRHYSQSSCENVTPSSSTSPLASHIEVTPTSPTGITGSDVSIAFCQRYVAIQSILTTIVT